MRDDGGPRAARRAPCLQAFALAALAALLCATAAPPAAAQAQRQWLRGYLQVQYQSQDQRGGAGEDVQWWTRTAQLDYTTRLREDLNLTAQAVWTDLSYIDRPDRRTQPRGSLRLTHRYFGANASYRPLRVTDAVGVTTKQHETLFSGYLARPGWPSVTGSWLRRHQLAGEAGPPSTGVTRSTQANHQIGPLAVRASWGDQTRFVGEEQTRSFTQTNFGGGGTLTLAKGSANGIASYDFQGLERSAPRSITQRTGIHTATASATQRFSKRIDATLNYAYRHTLIRNGSRTELDDNEGALLANLKATRAARLTAGGGVRTARFEDRRQTERYVLATASIEGPVRRGLTGVAAATRSYNWVPDETPHPVDTYRAGGTLRLARGLDASLDAQVTASRSRSAIADTAGGPTRVTAQSGFGFVAVPLRPISIGFTWREYRTGSGLFDPSAKARSTILDLRWSPSAAVSAYGTLSRARGLGASDPLVTTTTANAEWRPRSTVQLSGTYTRSDQVRYDPTTGFSVGREVFGARLLATVALDWRLQVSMNDADPGRPSHARQWDLSLTRTLRR